jgi:hypothetical protein
MMEKYLVHYEHALTRKWVTCQALSIERLYHTQVYLYEKEKRRSNRLK